MPAPRGGVTHESGRVTSAACKERAEASRENFIGAEPAGSRPLLARSPVCVQILIRQPCPDRPRRSAMDYSTTFARHFSRLVSLLIHDVGNTDEQKMALRALV